MFCVQNEKDVDGAHNFGVCLTQAVNMFDAFQVTHIEEHFNPALCAVRCDQLQPMQVAVGCSGHCWSNSQDPEDVEIALLSRVVYICSHECWVCLRVERAHSRHQRTDHSHRVSILPKSLNKGHQTLIKGVILPETAGKGLQLNLRWQFPKNG